MQEYPDHQVRRPSRAPTTALVLAVGGLAIALVAAILPWTLSNATSADPDFSEDPVATISLYIAGLLALGGVAVLVWRRTRTWPVVLAGLGLLVLVVALVLVPTAEVLWDGVDGQGRATGGYVRIERGPAGFVAVAGGVLATLGAIVGNRRDAPDSPAGPAGW
ncbi:DUF7937 domain-containing protein [Occultella gossypii]|uniref:DUF7937 domain-containing protein n=1 Tax=Occultella gossypii TaxID=2800820 RepID=A0ABS7SGP9_9MICO|nr:hypothetical protein [Occultella gossypii]MBZ2198969.1 hypothetical protein [Occultella gossypii]